MLIFDTVLIESFSCFLACLFSKHASFRKGAYYRASTVFKALAVLGRAYFRKMPIFKKVLIIAQVVQVIPN